MTYIQTALPRQHTIQPASILPAEAVSKQVQLIYARVENLAASYLLQPFSVTLVTPNTAELLLQTNRKWQQSKALPNNSFILVIAVRSLFNQESLSAGINDRLINNKLSRNHLTAYVENIRHSGNGADSKGTRWAEKQADLALQLITSSAKDRNLEAVVLKNDGANLFESDILPQEKGLTTYAIVAISQQDKYK